MELECLTPQACIRKTGRQNPRTKQREALPRSGQPDPRVDILVATAACEGMAARSVGKCGLPIQGQGLSATASYVHASAPSVRKGVAASPLFLGKQHAVVFHFADIFHFAAYVELARGIHQQRLSRRR